MCTRGFGVNCFGWHVKGRGLACERAFCVCPFPLNDLAGLKLPTKVLDPTVSLSAGATIETAAPARPGYLLGTGFKDLKEANVEPRV